MRILNIGPIPPEIGGQTGGGVASHLWALAGNLAKQGHTVGVLSRNSYTRDSQADERDGVQLYGLLGLGRSLQDIYVLFPSFWLSLIRTKIHFGNFMNWKGVITGLLNYHRVIKSFKPDVIHIHHLEYRFPFVYYLVGDQIPIITTIHSTSFIEFSPPKEAKKRKAFVKRNLDLAQNLIFVSQFLETRFDTQFPGGLDGKRANIVHNPVDGALFYPISQKTAREKIGLELDRSIILSVGNLIPQKDWSLIIEAVKQIMDLGLEFQLIIVGEGPQRVELEGLINKNGLSDQVRFEGHRSQEELHLYYNAADLFVLPSKMESFGLVFVEAMLCGCPVLGRAEVLREILPSERCGVFLPSSQPDDWSEYIVKILNQSWSKEDINQLSLVYTWERSGTRFEKIYREILNN
jgi:glycosyltransferase involved in cell wall biosynthesis